MLWPPAMAKLPFYTLLIFIASCDSSCWPKPGPNPRPDPDPNPQLSCVDGQPCVGGTCFRGTCIPDGYSFKGCVAVGQTCASQCPFPQCQTLPAALPSPQLCASNTPLPCICKCQ